MLTHLDMFDTNPSRNLTNFKNLWKFVNFILLVFNCMKSLYLLCRVKNFHYFFTHMSQSIVSYFSLAHVIYNNQHILIIVAEIQSSRLSSSSEYHDTLCNFPVSLTKRYFAFFILQLSYRNQFFNIFLTWRTLRIFQTESFAILNFTSPIPMISKGSTTSRNIFPWVYAI